MADLGLPARLPWVVPAVAVKNLTVSTVIGRSERGRRYLERVAAKYRQNRTRMLFEGARQHNGELPL